MSNWKGHVIAGFVINVMIFLAIFFAKKFDFIAFASWKIFFFSIPVIIIYSLASDIDLEGSKIYQFAILFSVGMAVIGYLAKEFSTKIVFLTSYSKLLPLGLILAVVTIVLGEFKHRGFTHTIAFGLIISSFLLYVHWFVALVGFISFMSHLLLDNEVSLYK